MAIISCPECGKQVSDRAVSCPECGCPISAAPVVAVQNSGDEVKKLLVLARRARESSDSKNAKRYYDQILDKDPGNWEAIFYTVYFEATECKIMHISSAANSVANCIYSTFAAISDLKDEDEQEEALDTVCVAALVIATMFVNSAVNHYNQFSTTTNAFSECANRVVASGNIYSEIEDGLKAVFPDLKKRLANHQKLYVSFLNSNYRWYNSTFLGRTKGRLDEEIGNVYPEYRKKKELENKISALNARKSNYPVVRTASSGCLGGFFLVVGIIMFVLGMMLMNLDGSSWPILVAIPELLLSVVFLQKKPSQAEVDQNMQIRRQIDAEIAPLQKELDSLG